MRLVRIVEVGIATTALSFSVACGEQAADVTSAAKTGEAKVEAAAKATDDTTETAKKELASATEMLEDNVEQSTKDMKDTYDAKRAEGTSAVEAAGDAYEAVLEEPSKEEAQKKATELME
jgi:hypothetical protein